MSIQVEVLLEGGAIPDKEDRGGDTAESWAREWGNPTCANILAGAVEKAVERRRKRTEELTQVRENRVEEGQKEEKSTTSDETGSQVEEAARYQDTVVRQEATWLKQLEAGKYIIEEGEGNYLDILKALVTVDEKIADDVYLKFV